MKQLIYVCLFFLLTNYLIAQNKIDSLIQIDKSIDTTKAHLIYDYLLPDWGYNTLSINFSGNGSGTERVVNEEKENSAFSGIDISPLYFEYYEGETCVKLLRFLLNSGYTYNSSQDKTENSDRTNKRTTLVQMISFDGNLNNYFSKNHFYKIQTKQQFRYSENDYVRKTDGEKSEWTNIFRQYNTINYFGIGFGRIRNITPVFRALRFNERIKDLFKTDLTSYEIKKIAELFTQINGYDSIYDRPDKYFYNDLPKEVKSKLSRLKPWEIFYLDEALKEIIGTRLEGYRIDVGININYDKENYSSNYYRELFLAGFYINQDYYHNVSLNYQIGFNLYASYLEAINNNTKYKSVGNGIFSLRNQWNLTDQLLVNWDSGYESGFLSAKEREGYSRWERLDEFFSYVYFSYYLENNLNIYLNANYGVIKGWPADVGFSFSDYNYNTSYDREKRWSFSVGLRYYIDRGIY